MRCRGRPDQHLVHQRAPAFDDRLQVSAPFGTGANDVLEADGLAGQFLTNGPAHEAVVPVDTNFRNLRGVVADRHGLPDEGSESGIDVP